ncbi:MAG: helix-turn-helix domain-containing protein [Defluviitaleaceae bacterium]|nr:helix-turn-helix domain-containing protein [Defluviitaleaceae bacterium]
MLSTRQKYKVEAFGANLKRMRKQKGFAKANALSAFLEKSPSYISMLEGGKRHPTIESLLEICEFFGTCPNTLLKAPETGMRLRESIVSYDSGSYMEKEKRHEMLLCILDTFNPDELAHVTEMIESFQKFTLTKKSVR